MDAFVVRDRNGHTAIVVGQGHVYVRLIEMRSGELCVSGLSEDQLAGRGFEVLDYSMQAAARRFLAHLGGVSAAARRALEALAGHSPPATDAAPDF